MEYEIVKNPMGLIEFTLNKDEKITAEDGDIEVINVNEEFIVQSRGIVHELMRISHYLSLDQSFLHHFHIVY